MVELTGIRGDELKLIKFFIHEECINLQGSVFVNCHASHVFFMPLLILCDPLSEGVHLWQTLVYLTVI